MASPENESEPLTGVRLIEILDSAEEADRWILSRLSKLELQAPTAPIRYDSTNPGPSQQRRKDLGIGKK